MNCLDSEIPRNTSFLNLHDSSLGRHVSATSRKSVEIQSYSWLSQNQEPLWSENLYEN